MEARVWLVVASVVCGVAGCNLPSQPSAHTAALTLSNESLALRQVQTRRFEAKREDELMSAAMGVLQDLGYTTEETSAGQGVLSATKRRAGVFIRASLVIRPVASGQGYIARVSFQSINAMGMAESITDPNIYSQFFDRLSQSVFLEAHQI